MQNDVLLSVENLHTWFELRRLGFVRRLRAGMTASVSTCKGEAVAVVEWLW